MIFVAKAWLWGVLTIPFVYALIALDERRRLARFEAFAGRALWPALAPEFRPGARLRKARVWCLAVTFVLLALARPQWGFHEESVVVNGLDVVIALDVSNSMEVEDVVPSRLRKAKHVIQNLAEKLQGDRIGIVAFAASSYVACPLTTDTSYLMETLDALSPKSVLHQGTDIGLGLDTALKTLDRGAEESGQNGQQARDQKSSRVVILISDGEDQDEQAVSAAKEFARNGTLLFVLGVGTQKGGPIPVRDESGNLVGYKHDHANQTVISTFRPDALLQVASAAGGKYWNVTPDEGEIDEVLREMGALNRSDYAERRYRVYEERFQIPLLLAVLLLILEVSLPLRRKLAGAAAVLVFLLGGVAVDGGGNAWAAKPTDSLQVYLENEKGIQALKDGKTSEAKQHFGEAQALDPKLPELEYNRGDVHAQEGDTENAEAAFRNAALGALKKGDAALAGRSFFNLGNVLAKKKDTKGAIQSYLNALSLAERTQDEALQHDARKNIELLGVENQKQKEQQKQDESKSKQQPKPDGGKADPKQKDGSGGDDQKKDQAKQGQDKQDGQPKQYEDPAQSRQRQFKSDKMTDEDARRVMSELGNREKELQAKLKRQQGQNHVETKDW